MPSKQKPIVLELQIPNDGSVSDQEAGHMLKILIHDIEEQAHTLRDTAKALLKNAEEEACSYYQEWLHLVIEEVKTRVGLHHILAVAGFELEDQHIEVRISDRDDDMHSYMSLVMGMPIKTRSQKDRSDHIPYVVFINHRGREDDKRDPDRAISMSLKGYLLVTALSPDMRLSHDTYTQLLKNREEAKKSVRTAEKQVDDLPRAIRKAEAKFAEHLLKKTKSGQDLLSLKG
jgi:hypothetical protein